MWHIKITFERNLKLVAFAFIFSIGEIKIRNQNFYGISLKSPIGSLLLGKKSGDEISFRDQTFTILKIE